MARPDQRPMRAAIATALGALVGGGLVGGVGYTHGTEMAVGAVAGVVLGGLLGRGVATGTISPVTLCAVLFAVVGGLIGPGSDDYQGTLAMIGAAFGGGIGWLFFRRRRHDDDPDNAADRPAADH